MSDRPDALQWVGEYDAAGQPLDYWGDIPARDLDATDIANLSDDQIARALGERAGGRPPLYRAPRPADDHADDAPPDAHAAPSRAKHRKE